MTAPRPNASRDQNHVTTLMGVSTADGITPVPVEVDPTTGQVQVSSTGGGGGGAATIADGADVAEGATTDAIVAAGAGGSVSAKLRRISQGLEDLKTLIVLGASSNVIGTVLPGNTANTTAWLFKELPWSVSSQTALTTVATVSAAAGQYGGGSFINLNSAPAYLQFFDTTGAVTLGVTVPNFVQPIPANATPANGAAFVFALGAGATLANGLKAAATTTPTGATTVTTALIGFISYR